VICREREPCTVFGSVPSFKPALFLLCQATQLPSRPVCPPSRLLGARGRAGSRLAAQQATALV